MLAGSDHVITAMNDITAVTSFDASERWLSRGCSVLLFVSAATTVTERDTGRLETPGCLRPRWAASSLGELAPNPPLNLVNSRSPLWFSSHSCHPAADSSCPSTCPTPASSTSEGSPGSPHTPLSTGCSQVCTHTPLFKKKAAHIRPPSGHGDHKVVLPSMPSDAVSCPPQGRRSGTVSLRSPATSPTPRTACSGGTSPSLTFLRSAMVRQREAEGLSPPL